MKILVTGATGLIGTDLLSDLNDEDHEIFAMSRGVNTPSAFQNVNWIQQDLEACLDTRQIPNDLDAIVHLAQSDLYRDFPENATRVFEVNTLSTQYLLDFASRTGVKTFILASSGGIYGFGEKAFRESDAPRPAGELGFYVGSKLCSEILAQSYSKQFNVVVLRFFFVYGPGQKRTMLIPRLLNSIREGSPIRLQGPAGIRINPIFVTDAAAAVRASLLLNESQVINVGGPDVVDLRTLCEMAGQVLGKTPVFEIEDRPAFTDLIGDCHEMHDRLGVPAVGIEAGLSRMVDTAEDQT